VKVKVDEQLIKYLEKLSSLKLEEEERKKLLEDIRRILEYMELLDEVDVDGVEEMVSPVELPMLMREDIPELSSSVEAILKLFPDRSGRFLRLPPIRGDE